MYDAPSFLTPYAESGYGLHLVFQEGDDVGVLGTWRRAGDEVDLGLRAGLMEVGDEVGLLAGVDLKNQVVTADDDFPLDVAWVSGAGVGFVPDADAALLRVPFGASLGRRVDLEGGSALVPYVHPRLALDIFFFDPPGAGDGDSEAELDFDVDLGADLELGGGPTLRLGITLGHSEAIGLGVAF